MWSITDIKSLGRRAFKSNYWPCVGAGVLLTILSMGSTAASSRQTTSGEVANQFSTLPSDQQAIVAAVIAGTLSIITIVAILLRIFLFNPLKVGSYHFFKENINDTSTTFGAVGAGFNNYGHTFATLFITDLFTCLWALLFIIPGIIKIYSYRLVPYLIVDHPELSATQTIALSKRLMQGNKGRAFLMDLSFIGWHLLGIITLGLVEIFWTVPYKASSDAALYLELTRR